MLLLHLPVLQLEKIHLLFPLQTVLVAGVTDFKGIRGKELLYDAVSSIPAWGAVLRPAGRTQGSALRTSPAIFVCVGESTMVVGMVSTIFFF